MTLPELAEVLNRLSFVRWDRCVPRDDGSGVVYGWISRPDGRADFVLVEWDTDTGVGFTTSSAAHSEEISRLLHGDDPDSDHRPCQAVEDVFGDLLNRRVNRQSRDVRVVVHPPERR